MDFLANENFPLVSIRLLRNAGHNVGSVLEETSGARDSAVLQRGHEESRIILTFDRDYGELIYRHESKVPAGLVFFRFDPATPEEPAEILMEILEKGKINLVGKFTVVERGKMRQRTFPKIS